MEISLLLSAAQSSALEDGQSTAPSSYLVTSPVSVTNYEGQVHLNLPALEEMGSGPRAEQRTIQLPSFARLTHAAAAASLSPQGRIEKKPAKPFKCTFEGCEATFGQKGSLTRHIKSRHEKLRPHTCDLCQKSFSALWTLRVHQRNVHLKSKPHKCHLCDKSFGELFNKSKHIAIVHEGKRPFACPICSRAFGYKGDMRKHVMELHEQTGRPFQCMVPTCGVKFARKRYLRRHENLSHKGHPLLANRDSTVSPNQTATIGYEQRPDIFYLGQSAGVSTSSASSKETVPGHGVKIEGQLSGIQLPKRYPGPL